MKIAICDDEKHFREKLHRVLISYENLLPNTLILEFPSGEELIKHYNECFGFDIIFLDIEMQGLTGIESGEKIRQLDDDVLIIFVTSHTQYAIPAIKVGVSDYILKPFSSAEIIQVLENAIKKYQSRHFIVTLECRAGNIHKLDISEIVYAEFRNRTITFYTNSYEYECIGILHHYEALLAPYGFFRCHKNLLVNMKYIKTIEKNLILTTTGIKLDISARKRKECMKKFGEYIARNHI